MFLREYLQHQTQRAALGGITNGLWHCHVKGLHSIVFHDDVVGRQRMFIADQHHQLHRNFMLNFGAISKDQSIAFHSHHCDITLIPVLGNVTNITPSFGSLKSMKEESWLCGQYKYQSAINGKAGGLKSTGKGRALRDLLYRELRRPLRLRAEEFHTIAVPKGEPAVWIVLEGQEDPNYKSQCYTFNPNFDASEFYKPMSKEEIGQWMAKVLMLYNIRSLTR